MNRCSKSIRSIRDYEREVNSAKKPVCDGENIDHQSPFYVVIATYGSAKVADSTVCTCGILIEDHTFRNFLLGTAHSCVRRYSKKMSVDMICRNEHLSDQLRLPREQVWKIKEPGI